MDELISFMGCTFCIGIFGVLSDEMLLRSCLSNHLNDVNLLLCFFNFSSMHRTSFVFFSMAVAAAELRWIAMLVSILEI